MTQVFSKLDPYVFIGGLAGAIIPTTIAYFVFEYVMKGLGIITIVIFFITLLFVFYQAYHFNDSITSENTKVKKGET